MKICHWKSFKNLNREPLAEQINSVLFPEEYDFMLDSIYDPKGGRRRINPMSADYAAKVNARRKELEVSLVGDHEMPTNHNRLDVAVISPGTFRV
jgi:hypothetical protein